MRLHNKESLFKDAIEIRCGIQSDLGLKLGKIACDACVFQDMSACLTAVQSDDSIMILHTSP